MQFSFGPPTFSSFFPALGSGLGIGFYFEIRYEKGRFYKLKVPTTFGIIPQSFH